MYSTETQCHTKASCRASAAFTEGWKEGDQKVPAVWNCLARSWCSVLVLSWGMDSIVLSPPCWQSLSARAPRLPALLLSTIGQLEVAVFPLPVRSCQTLSRWFHPHLDKALSTGLTWEAKEMHEQLHIPSVITCFSADMLWPGKTSDV